MTAHYVYRCYDADGALLYVGQTKDAPTRLAQHNYRSFWAGDVVHVKVTAHPSAQLARDIERRAIRDEHPRFNNQGRWTTRNQWTEQMFVDYARTLLESDSTDTGRLRQVFANYQSKFGSGHPLEESTRALLAERARRTAIARKVDTARLRANRLRVEAADAESYARHLEQFPCCAAEPVTDFCDACMDEPAPVSS